MRTINGDRKSRPISELLYSVRFYVLVMCPVHHTNRAAIHNREKFYVAMVV